MTPSMMGPKKNKNEFAGPSCGNSFPPSRQRRNNSDKSANISAAAEPIPQILKISTMCKGICIFMTFSQEHSPLCDAQTFNGSTPLDQISQRGDHTIEVVTKHVVEVRVVF